MKKIYVVTAGDYSDYQICGVFSSEDIAKKYIDSFKRGENSWSYNEMEIEEWNLDPLKKEIAKGYFPYFVRMAKNGDTSDVHIEDSDYGFDRGNSTGFDRDGNLYHHCFAKDSIHAIKITNELRARTIAENKWPE